MFILIQSFNQATSILISWLKRFRKLTGNLQQKQPNNENKQNE